MFVFRFTAISQEAALKEALERSHAAHAEAMKEAKAEADDYQRGLADRARSKFLASKQGGGLVIHRALYGVLPLGGSSGWRGPEFEETPLGMAGAKDFEESDGSSLLDTTELEPEPQSQLEHRAAEREGGEYIGETADAGARECMACYDVTTALQLRVEEKARRGVGSKLRIETDTDFAEQQGFADPCMGVKKQLRIAYSWRGQQFLAVSQAAWVPLYIIYHHISVRTFAEKASLDLIYCCAQTIEDRQTFILPNEAHRLGN